MKKTLVIAVSFAALALLIVGFLFLPGDPQAAIGGRDEKTFPDQAKSDSEGATSENIRDLILEYVSQSASTPATPVKVPGQPPSLGTLTITEALKVAQAQNKYILIYFWATWCSNCEIFNKHILPDKTVLENLSKSFLFVPIDSDLDPEALSALFKVRAVPTFIFLTPEGIPATVLPGMVPADIFTMVLNYISSGSYEKMEFEDFAK
jgi:thioredoxin-related protein